MARNRCAKGSIAYSDAVCYRTQQKLHIVLALLSLRGRSPANRNATVTVAGLLGHFSFETSERSSTANFVWRSEQNLQLHSSAVNSDSFQNFPKCENTLAATTRKDCWLCNLHFVCTTNISSALRSLLLYKAVQIKGCRKL